MKFPPGQNMIPRRGASLRGVGIWKETPRYGQVFQKHPKRQPARTAGEAQNRQTLAAAARIVGLMSPEQLTLSREISEISQLAARDFAMIMLFTRAFYVIMPDGRKVYSMASMQDTSQLLDVLGQTPGNILMRGDTWWSSIPPGAVNQVLTMLDAKTAGWKNASSGGGGLPIWMQPNQINPHSGATINPGNVDLLPVLNPLNVTATGLKVFSTSPGSGKQLAACIYADNGNTPVGGALIASSAAVTAIAGVNLMPFTAPVALSADTVYWYGINVFSGSGNFQAAGLATTRNDYCFFAQAGASFPSACPAVTFGTGGSQFSWYGY
jgi:hypothetical protein